MSAADATFSLESGGLKKEPRELGCVQMQFDGTMKLMLRASTQGRGVLISSHPSVPSLVLCACVQPRLWAGSTPHFPVLGEVVSAAFAPSDDS